MFPNAAARKSELWFFMDNRQRPFAKNRRLITLFVLYWPVSVIGTLLGSYFVEFPFPDTLFNKISFVLTASLGNILYVLFAPLLVLSTLHFQNPTERVGGIVCMPAAISLTVLWFYLATSKDPRHSAWFLYCLISFVYSLSLVISNVAYLIGNR